MNNSKSAILIKWTLWALLIINLAILILISRSISGININYPPYLKLIVTLITMLNWTIISVVMIVYKISKIRIHYMIMFVIGIALALSWIPLYNSQNKSFQWIYFSGDIFVISTILAINYFLNIVFVRPNLILTLRRYLKVK
ncbi:MULTISPECIES: hypothetical protein [unclassified Mycoplasma]|uniref:hypothetical protein n=1 Tax=unclassified Mycoplasma TaxID=2683645 RepID=UPI00211BAC5D|nr:MULTISPECIES: hypothetical protein [unclassified Mycoplasma]UUM19682.1 hypothetical protein NPA11_02840 [Mycoplasma sp. 1578d]UUM24665.1 hypothetical protein NPA12_03135 [Mycoplasma sp. 3686d]